LVADLTAQDYLLPSSPRHVIAKASFAETRGPVLQRPVRDNHHVLIGEENYVISGGYLMPARKDHAPPDLRNFATGRMKAERRLF
jgi:hypothetical protein